MMIRTYILSVSYSMRKSMNQPVKTKTDNDIDWKFLEDQKMLGSTYQPFLTDFYSGTTNHKSPPTRTCSIVSSTLPPHHSPTFLTLPLYYPSTFPTLLPHYRPTFPTIPPHYPLIFPPHYPPTFLTSPPSHRQRKNSK